MDDQDPSNIDAQILTRYPYPIAVGYRRMLDAPDAPTRVELALAVFEYGLRAVTLGLVSQYLIRDAEQVTDRNLNALLLEYLPRATLGTWKRIFFETLRAYKDHRTRFFMPELYDLYWDTSRGVPHARRGVEEPYNRLISIRNNLVHRPKPTAEAEWQVLEADVLSQLRVVLQQFAFIQNYTLLRVVEQNHRLYPHYYTGDFIRISTNALPLDPILESGWFYLANASGEFLLLHPLLVFWEVPPTGDMPARFTSDAALYDTFSKSTAIYIAAVLRKAVAQPTLAEPLRHLLYDTIEQVKRQRIEVQHLTWELLNHVAQEIADQRFREVRAKYNPQLYLQREQIKSAFEDFLLSDKTAFLLLGRSGVGKSSFFLSLADEYETRDQICLLLYDGAKLDTDRPLAELIARDFDTHIQLRTDVGMPGFGDLLAELARIEGIERRWVVLFIDAVNENADAKALLRRIDALVADNVYPWFKVVFSSRPEAWRAMKRGVKLTEHRYYQVAGQEDLGVELQPFSFEREISGLGIRMDPFSKAELPAVYAKYQAVYELQTPYEALPHGLPEILTDPLTLKLVARTYHQRAIPAVIRPSDIYRDYVNQLVADGLLDVLDVRLLEDELLPLMIAEGQYANAITEAQVHSTRVSDGRPLFDLIFNDERLSSGRAINQSFQNLANAEILVLRGTPTDYEVGFKYERFYDYYGGKRVYALAGQEADRAEFFEAMIIRTIAQPFLWGPVKSALVGELKAYGSDSVRPLCYTKEQRVKEMIVSVLAEWGHDQPAEATAFIRGILPPTDQPSSTTLIWRVLRPSDSTQDPRLVNAWKIAMDAAGALGLADVLQAAALQPNLVVRSYAVRQIYHLWQRNMITGFAILEALVAETLRTTIPNPAGFEAVFSLSLILFFDHPNDPTVLGRLQQIWRRIIDKTLEVGAGGNPLTTAWRDFRRERLFDLAITVLFRLLHEMPSYAVVNYPDLVAFFQRSADEKRLYTRLTRYIDVAGPYTREEMEQDVLAATRINDLLIEMTTHMVMVMHMQADPDRWLSFEETFFSTALSVPQVNGYVAAPPFHVSKALERYPGNDSLFDFLLRATAQVQDYYTQHRAIPGLHRNIPSAAAMYVDTVIYFQYHRTQTMHIPWIESRIKTALADTDVAFFQELLATGLTVTAIEKREPRIALEAISLFFNTRQPEIDEHVRAFLARLRVFYPDLVDDFLEEQNAPEEWRLYIRTHEPVEVVGALIGTRTLDVLYDVMERSPVLRRRIIWAMTKAAEYKDLRSWMIFLLREVVNLVYGDAVFTQPGT